MVCDNVFSWEIYVYIFWFVSILGEAYDVWLIRMFEKLFGLVNETYTNFGNVCDKVLRLEMKE